MIKSIQLQNLGTGNKNRISILTNNNGEFNLYFSYAELVGFEYWVDMNNGEGGIWHKKRVRENVWSTTTGKLLNEIEPDKKARIGKERFENELGEMMLFLQKATSIKG